MRKARSEKLKTLVQGLHFSKGVVEEDALPAPSARHGSVAWKWGKFCWRNLLKYSGFPNPRDRSNWIPAEI